MGAEYPREFLVLADGFPREEFLQDGFLQDGFLQDGFPQEGFPQDDFPQEGFPLKVFPEEGMNTSHRNPRQGLQSRMQISYLHQCPNSVLAKELSITASEQAP